MEKSKLLELQQLEFFLLHDLIVKDLKLLRNTKRLTPSHYQNSNDMVQRGIITLNGLFRSALVKIFPTPFHIKKTLGGLEFYITMPLDIKNKLSLNRTSIPCQNLIAVNENEMGMIRFRFPNTLIIYIAKGTRNRRYYYNNYGYEISDIGIGKYCGALRSALSWKERLYVTLKSIDEIEKEKEPTKEEVKQISNPAQEALEAVLKAAAAAGKL